VAPREGPKSLFIATIDPSAVRIDLPCRATIKVRIPDNQDENVSKA
jgi:hypothetical protein